MRGRQEVTSGQLGDKGRERHVSRDILIHIEAPFWKHWQGLLEKNKTDVQNRTIQVNCVDERSAV